MGVPSIKGYIIRVAFRKLKYFLRLIASEKVIFSQKGPFRMIDLNGRYL